MNELDLIKLNIYESYNNNELTEDEKDYLLEHVEYIQEAGTVVKGLVGAGAGAAATGLVTGAMYRNKEKQLLNYLRTLYDSSHPDEIEVSKLNKLEKTKYIMKREKAIRKSADYKKFVSAALKDTGKNIGIGAGVGAGVGTAAGLVGNKRNKRKANSVDNSSIPDEVIDTQEVNESTFDYLLESINDLYYDD